MAPVQDGNPVPSDVSVSTLLIQLATATSYVAVCWNASAASRCRSARVKPPAATAASTSAYRAGLVTMATEGWFLAAARTIDGPPMSICSTHSSGLAPDRTVWRNG